VSIIERATQRLAELKNAGIGIPDGMLTEEELAGVRAPAPMPAPVRGLGTEGKAGRPASPFLTREPAAEPGTQSATPSRTSSQVTVDLHRLRLAGMITPDAPRSRLASEFRVIKRPLIKNASGQSASPLHRSNIIMVTSSTPQEGKTFVALNLAMSIAMEVDKTVLLVDGDVISPDVLPRLGLENRKGLTDLIASPGLDVSEVLLKTNIERLTLLPAGTAHERSSELLTSEAMGRLIEELAARYPDRIVIFDSPPLLATTEARVLAAHVGQVVLVVHADRTSQGSVRESLALLEQCPVVCTVLNGAAESPLGSYYGYSHATDQNQA